MAHFPEHCNFLRSFPLQSSLRWAFFGWVSFSPSPLSGSAFTSLRKRAMPRKRLWIAPFGAPGGLHQMQVLLKA